MRRTHVAINPMEDITMPLSEPRIITRDATAYAAIPLEVNQPEIPQVAPPLVHEILAWAEAHARQTGPVFFNYTSMQAGQKMAMEVGLPIEKPVPGDQRVKVGTLPGGRYATVTWTGPYDQLYSAHDKLHQWLAKQNLPKQSQGGSGEKGMTLLEIYHTDPDDLPNPADWVTEIAFKLAD
jgi:effector-binding domain-containing protein